MNKNILVGLIAAGLLISTSGLASAGSIRECVIEKGAMELSEGQMALLMAHGDGKINILSTAHDNDLGIADGLAVHALMWRAGIACTFGG